MSKRQFQILRGVSRFPQRKSRISHSQVRHRIAYNCDTSVAMIFSADIVVERINASRLSNMKGKGGVSEHPTGVDSGFLIGNGRFTKINASPRRDMATDVPYDALQRPEVSSRSRA